MSKKINKSELWIKVQDAIANTVNNTDTLKKGKGDTFTAELISALTPLLEPKSGGTSTKINVDGEVWCNYFQRYLTADMFNTKLSKPNKDTGERTEQYKANSINAEIILRKVKTLKTTVTTLATTSFRDKIIDGDEFETILTSADKAAEAIYSTVDDVPTVADVVGLTKVLDTIQTGNKPADTEEEA